ncbi:hypothetical protein Droror1_Dr00017684, partial [Drosera rotundifolia]
TNLWDEQRNCLVHIDEAGADMQKEVVAEHEKALDALANALLERGTLSGEDIKQVVLPFQGRPAAEP